jgi:hypothetical protein
VGVVHAGNGSRPRVNRIMRDAVCADAGPKVKSAAGGILGVTDDAVVQSGDGCSGPSDLCAGS